MEVPSPTLTFNGPGVQQAITPNTRNGSDAEAGYSFTLHDGNYCQNLTPVVVQKKKKKKKFNLPFLKVVNNCAQILDELEFIQKEEMIKDLQQNVGVTTPVFMNEEERNVQLLYKVNQ